ncbi:MAG: archease [Deltaproteobacteria bacterium]|nr:archease [Deltaproteobacteria bacterium]
MPYAYREHIADMGIEASAGTLAGAFEAGVEAMLNLMFDLSTIEESLSFPVAATGRDIELLFVEVLNETLSIQGLRGLALKRIKVDSIKTDDDRVALSGIVYGEKFDRQKHVVKTEVKGATYSGLFYNSGEGGTHVLRCVLDV